MLRARFVLVASIAAAAASAFAACSDAATAQPCTNIPAGGCPRSRGVACEDPACAAVYLCRPDNVWELERQCPPRPPRDAAAPPLEDAGTTPSFDASIDAPPGAYGGPGCGTLQTPDCSLGLALGCGAGCCGCEDLFVCQGGGWELWGVCGDGGIAPGF